MKNIFLKFFISILSCFLLCTSAKAQLEMLKKPSLNISYIGHDYFRPGIKVGTQFHYNKRTKERKRSKKIIRKSYFINPQIGLNVHYRNHTALILNIEFGSQRKYPNGLYTAISAGVGNLTQFNWGNTYLLQEDNSIKEKQWASRSYFLPNLNLEMGKEINSKTEIFGKLTAAAKVNYNTIPLLPQIFWELGVKLSL